MSNKHKKSKKIKFEFKVLTDDVFVKGIKKIYAYTQIISSSKENAIRRLKAKYLEEDLPIYEYDIVNSNEIS